MPTARKTNSVVLDRFALLADTPNTVKSDITVAIPRISVAEESRKHTDFSELDTFVQETWHHGRGALNLVDTATFYKAWGLTTHVRDEVMAGPLIVATDNLNGLAKKFIFYSTTIYVLIAGTAAANNEVWSWDDSMGSWTDENAGLDTTASGDPQDMEVFDDHLFVAQGEAVNMRHYNGITWGAMTAPANFLKVWDDKLWRADNVNEIYYSSDAASAAGSETWNGAYEVGDTSSRITGMDVFQNQLIVFKTDGVYAVEFDNLATGVDYRVQQLLEYNDAIDNDNGKGHVNWQGQLYFNKNFGIDRFNGATLESVGLERGAGGAAPIVGLFNADAEDPSFVAIEESGRGKAKAMTGTEEALYAAIDVEASGGVSQIAVYQGLGWHTFIGGEEDPEFFNGTAETWQDDRITSVFAIRAKPAGSESGALVTPTLWFNRGETIYYVAIPEGTANPDDYSQFGFTNDTSGVWRVDDGQRIIGELYTGWFDGGLSDVAKGLFTVVVQAEDLVEGEREIKVQYQIFRFDSAWYDLGTVNFSGEQEIAFPDNRFTESILVGKEIRFRLQFINNSSSNSPRLKAFLLRFISRPKVKYGWNVPIYVEDQVRMTDGRRDTITKEEFRGRIWNIRDTERPVFWDDGVGLPAVTNVLLNPNFGTIRTGSEIANSDIDTPDAVSEQDPLLTNEQTWVSTDAGTVPLVDIPKQGVNESEWATVTMPPDNMVDEAHQSEFLKVQDFGFNVPTNATIVGVAVTFNKVATQDTVKDLKVFIVDELGAIKTAGENKAKTGEFWPEVQDHPGVGIRYGGSTDLWGLSAGSMGISNGEIGPADVNDPDFGFAISCQNTHAVATGIAYIGWVNVQVFYTVNNVGALATGWANHGTAAFEDPTDPKQFSRSSQYKVGLLPSQAVTLSTGATGDEGFKSEQAINVANGEDIFGSAFVYVAEGNDVTVQLYDATNATVRASQTISAYAGPGPLFTRAELSWTNDTGMAAGIQLRIIRLTPATAANTTFYVSQCELIQGVTENFAYVDGDQPRCHWNSTPHNSTSSRRAGFWVYITGINESYRNPQIYVSRDGTDHAQEVAGVMNLQLREVGN